MRDVKGFVVQKQKVKSTYPAKVDGSVSEVTREFSSGNVLHDANLKEANKGKNLQSTSDRDGGRGSPARSEVGELGSRVVNITREVDAGLVDQEANNGKHGDTSVLEFDITKTLELFLVSIGDEAKRVPVSEGGLSTKLVFKGVEGRGGSSLLGRSKGRSRGEERGDNSELHLDKRVNTRIVSSVEGPCSVFRLEIFLFAKRQVEVGYL